MIVALVVGLAIGLLQDFASALGVDQAWLAAYEPSPDCQAYPAFVAWLAKRRPG